MILEGEEWSDEAYEKSYGKNVQAQKAAAAEKAVAAEKAAAAATKKK